MSDVIILNRDKKNRGYSSGKRIFKLNAAAKKKPRRHNTEVSILQQADFPWLFQMYKYFYSRTVCCYNG